MAGFFVPKRRKRNGALRLRNTKPAGSRDRDAVRGIHRNRIRGELNMAFTFEQLFAADPANPSSIAQNAAITIFAPGDVTQAPLTITDPSGSPLSNPILVNANGFGSAFAHETLDRVAWAGGGFTGFVTSYEGMKQVALDAQAAAETAGADAAEAAAAGVAGVVADADAAAVSAAASATAAANSAALVGAPADTAVQTLINATGSATRGALNATYARGDVAAKGMVCFVWDDGFQSHDTVAQMANARGQKHSFGVVSTFMNSGNPSYATPATVLSWFNAGHEIVSHSATHANMTGSSQATRITEYDSSKAALEAVVGVGNVRTFMYPYGGGARSATTDRELYLRYDRLLATGPYVPIRWDNRDRENEFVIRRNTWDGGATNQQNLLAQIRQCATMPMILVTQAHDLGATSAPTLAQVTEAMDLAQSLGIPCVTTAQAFPVSSRLVNPGFEQHNAGALVGWSMLKSDAGQSCESVADTPQAGLTGSRSLRLQSTADTVTYAYARQVVELQANTRYKVTGTYRVAIASGTGNFNVRVQEYAYDELGSILATNSGVSLNSTTWAPFTIEFTTNAYTRFGYLDLVLSNVTGQAWVDHVDIRPVRHGAFG